MAQTEVGTPRPPEVDNLIHMLYASEYSNMIRYACSVLGDVNLAEVAVQETFLVALRKSEQFSTSPSPVGWLYKALKFTMKHMLREKQQTLLRTLSLVDISDRELTREDHYPAIDKDLLESSDAALLSSFYLSGYSIKEIAANLGITEGACKMRLMRARKKLSKKEFR